MAGVTHPPMHVPAGECRLAVSAYDRVSSLLVSLLILVGTVTSCLLLVWLASRVFLRPRPVPVVMETIGGRGDAAPGLARDWDPPGAEELPDVLELDAARTLATLSEVARSAALLDISAESGHETATARQGDSRDIGPDGEGVGSGVPRHHRWEVVFDEGLTLEDYARQLDHFGIELAVLGGASTITYVSGLSKDRPAVRTGPGSEERRLFFRWRAGSLQDADRELLKKAGVPTAGRLIVQFCPPDTENTLALLERERAGNRDVAQIRKTVFGVRRDGVGFAFFVLSQYYR